MTWLACGRRVAGATVALLAAGCATQGLGDRVGTTVTGGEREVVLTWVPEHGWDANLGSRGAQLFAEYRTAASGLVREPLATARAQGNRTIRFPLPEALRAPPTGAVCLFIQPVGMQMLLPVRKAGMAGTDSARFRHASWEATAAAKVASAVTDRQAQALRQRLTAYDAEVQRRENALATRGWAQPAACESIKTTTTDTRTPYDVLPPEQHDQAARRVCVHRFAVARMLVDDSQAALARQPTEAVVEMAQLRMTHLAHATPLLADRLLKESATWPADLAGASQKRQREAREFLADWQRWRDQVGERYVPHVGKQNDYLSLNAHARELQAKLLKRDRDGVRVDESMAALSPRDRLGLAGASLDAYFGCTEDVRKQLATKHDAWLALSREGPQRDRMRREFFVQECRNEHGRLQSLRSERDQVQAQLAALAPALAPVAPAAPSGGRELNFAACE